jgi:hypothetical protein
MKPSNLIKQHSAVSNQCKPTYYNTLPFHEHKTTLQPKLPTTHTPETHPVGEFHPESYLPPTYAKKATQPTDPCHIQRPQKPKVHIPNPKLVIYSVGHRARANSKPYMHMISAHNGKKEKKKVNASNLGNSPKSLIANSVSIPLKSPRATVIFHAGPKYQ